MSVEELVKRLRKKQERVHDLSGVGYMDDPDCHEAADNLEELAAENERQHQMLFRQANTIRDQQAALAEKDKEISALTEALEPFAETADHDIGTDENDDDIFHPMTNHNRAAKITVGDMRRALSAISLTPTSVLAAVRDEVREECAKIAECHFDDRGNGRSGHHSEMDWTDGYRDATKGSAAAIRARKETGE